MRVGRSRRRSLRRSVAVECALRSNHWDGAVSLFASDLSGEGVWIETPLALDAGEELIVSFRAPGTSYAELWAAASVARVGLFRRAHDVFPSGMGLEFTYLSDVDRRVLHNALIGRPPPLPKRMRPPPLPYFRPQLFAREIEDDLPSVLDEDLASDLEFTSVCEFLTSPRPSIVQRSAGTWARALNHEARARLI